MRQFLLATTQIALPVGAFTGYDVYRAKATDTADATTTSLGDLSAFRSIITDAQAIAATGDLAAARTRVKGFEITWDAKEKASKPMDPGRWGQVDEAVLSALCAAKPDPVHVTETLVALQARLSSSAAVTQ
jgi:hypothetical protein